MKRSEAIAIIQKAFEDQGIRYVMYAHEASTILSALEKAGMLPPPKHEDVHKLNDDGLHILATYNFHPDDTGDMKTLWEPEEDIPRSGAV